GLGQPAPHGLARDALLTGDRGHRRSHGGVLLGVLAHEPHAPRAQLGIDLLRHAVYPLGLKQQRHQTRDSSGNPGEGGTDDQTPRNGGGGSHNGPGSDEGTDSDNGSTENGNGDTGQNKGTTPSPETDEPEPSDDDTTAPPE